MLDNFNPTNQFHPYQKVGYAPNADKPRPRLLDRVRRFLRRNPMVAVGALAIFAFGLGHLIRGMAH